MMFKLTPDYTGNDKVANCRWKADENSERMSNFFS